jgi:hypothetical protein
MTTKTINDSVIEQLNKQWWDEAVSTYGHKFKVPTEVASDIGEKIRALYVIQLFRKNSDSSKNPVSFLSSYSVLPHVAEWVAQEYCGIESVEEVKQGLKVEKRADKWGAFLKWASQHHFEQFTTEELTEQSGFSYQTTLNYLQESPTFRKIKKGLWEVRDAKADKKAGI